MVLEPGKDHVFEQEKKKEKNSTEKSSCNLKYVWANIKTAFLVGSRCGVK